jgi:hypothetical protein
MNLREKARRKFAKQLALKMVAELDRQDEETIRAWKGARSALQRGYRRPVNRQAAKDLAH